MGKKSLFKPTTGPVKMKKAPAPKKARSKKATAKAPVEPSFEPVSNPAEEISPPAPEQAGNVASAATAAPAPEPEISAVKETGMIPEPEKNISGKEATAAAEPSVEPETGAAEALSTPAPEKISDGEAAAAAEAVPAPDTSPVKTSETDVPSAEAKVSSLEADVPFFENDSLIDTKPLLLAIVGVCGLIMVLLIASKVNAGRYYVKQSKGAVIVSKGDFSPVGKDRIMILHGTRWNREKKNSYSRDDVFSFAALYYLEKAMTLADAPVSDDFDRIVDYLARARKLVADGEYQGAAVIIKQARRNITEAQVLQSSGERDAVSLAQEKLDAAGQALSGLIADMAKIGRETDSAEAGH
jgi:hypothetical protein